MEEIIDAAKKSNIHTFISSLPLVSIIHQLPSLLPPGSFKISSHTVHSNYKLPYSHSTSEDMYT
jgi:ABC-type multidrug transport system fused ATPase/permease subunit